MISRRARGPRCLLALSLAALASLAPAGAWADASKVVKIAILSTAFKAWHPATEGFRDALEGLGYTAGRNVHLEVRAAEGDTARLPVLARELVGLGPALFYCVGIPAAAECARAAPSVPLVFTEVPDPVRGGLVKSLSGPGGNATGIANLGSELAAKRLELFKEVVPSLRRVLVTYDPREAEEQAALVVARRAAGALGLTLLERPITSPADMEPGLAQLKPGGRDGILIVQFGAHLGIAGRSLEVATSNALPTMYPSPFWTTYGALASYGPDQYHQGRQAARLAHRILTGTPPSALPVELPDRVEFTINRKVATRLGLSVPGAVLVRADHVIE